ncbi:hypothetical protein BTVI_141264 [Pitangus sulphuratus]|nr:hypothetical protein BTVI_141264 [Pitangus sulphuratus]
MTQVQDSHPLNICVLLYAMENRKGLEKPYSLGLSSQGKYCTPTITADLGELAVPEWELFRGDIDELAVETAKCFLSIANVTNYDKGENM